MPRYTRNSIVLAKIETTAGTDAAPTVGANAVLISNLTVNPLNANNLPRDLIKPFFGGSEHLVGSSFVELEFEVEYQHSGTAGTVAAWDALLQSCGFAAGSVLATPARVEHNLISDYSTWKTLTLYYYDDGVLHKALGAKGTVSLALGIGTRPTMKFKFTALDGGITAVTPGAPTLTGYKLPLAITDTNTGALTLGCTYATGALSSGTEYVSAGIELDLGNQVKFTDLLGTAALPGQSVDVTDRETVGKVMFDLTAANEVSFMTTVKAASTQSMGLVHGTTAGLKLLLFCPAVQLINPRKEDKDGRRMIGYDLRILPSASGNDEIKLVGL